MNRVLQILALSLFFTKTVCAYESGIGENLRFVGDKRAMEICAAALRSENSITSEAKRLHMTRKALKTVTCNGQSPADFSSTNAFIIGSSAVVSAK